MTTREFNTKVCLLEGQQVSQSQAQIDETLARARELCARNPAAFACWVRDVIEITLADAIRQTPAESFGDTAKVTAPIEPEASRS